MRNPAINKSGYLWQQLLKQVSYPHHGGRQLSLWYAQTPAQSSCGRLFVAVKLVEAGESSTAEDRQLSLRNLHRQLWQVIGGSEAGWKLVSHPTAEDRQPSLRATRTVSQAGYSGRSWLKQVSHPRRRIASSASRCNLPQSARQVICGSEVG
jgi:hypothetical protein